MNDRIGKLNSGFVWLFALGAVALGIGAGYATAGMGVKVSSAVSFVIFAGAGYAAALLTRAKTWMAGMAFVVASLAVGAGYYIVVAKAVSDATASAGTGSAASTFGALMGVFVAALALISTLVAGVGGVVAGAKARAKLAPTA